MKSLVIGMGIGGLYKAVLEDLGHKVITVDSSPSKAADYSNVTAALTNGPFDTVHICTPNFTHEKIAIEVAKSAKIVFVEKPGVKDAASWKNLVTAFPGTRFMMVKNNQWRVNIDELRAMADESSVVDLNWINHDRVPSPGTWFTTKHLAFGGVSRDLMPHLLSLYIKLNPHWRTDAKVSYGASRRWELEQLIKTDYGTVKADGEYNVDDKCHLSYNGKWHLVADWRSMSGDKRNIDFVLRNGEKKQFELGLCPEDAYQRMIEQAKANIDNDAFWDEQLEMDLWIHEQISNLNK